MGCKESEVQILSPRPDGRPGHRAAVVSFKFQPVGVSPRAMRILLTNDDGIHAEGLEHLAQAFTEASLGEVWVVAPADEQSATSHAISLGRPLRIRRFEERSFSVTGTPTDCVYVGVHHLMKGRAPDLVVSGINHGANLGTDVTYSGTIGGAMEGCGLGATSLAISSLGQGPTDLRGAAQFALAMARKALEEGLPEGVFLNLNVPKGWRPAHGWCWSGGIRGRVRIIGSGAPPSPTTTFPDRTATSSRPGGRP